MHKNGPVPCRMSPAWRMFDVMPDETVRLAAAEGFSLILQFEDQDEGLRRLRVSWTHLAFRKHAA
jgi:hypothetical protein